MECDTDQTPSEASNDSTPFWKDPEAIASHMEDVVWGMAEAVNTRLFEAHSSSQYFAAEFAVELGRGPAKVGLATHYNDV